MALYPDGSTLLHRCAELLLRHADAAAATGRPQAGAAEAPPQAPLAGVVAALGVIINHAHCQAALPQEFVAQERFARQRAGSPAAGRGGVELASDGSSGDGGGDSGGGGDGGAETREAAWLDAVWEGRTALSMVSLAGLGDLIWRMQRQASLLLQSMHAWMRGCCRMPAPLSRACGRKRPQPPHPAGHRGALHL